MEFSARDNIGGGLIAPTAREDGHDGSRENLSRALFERSIHQTLYQSSPDRPAKSLNGA
jgi:hypothetical protein